MSSPFESLKKTRKVPLNGATKSGRSTGVPYRQTANTAAPSDMELLGSMATRLSQTEQQLRVSMQQVIEKDKKIRVLEEKVSLLQKARGYGEENIEDLGRKCRALQQQVHDMEEFLADYGMIWVGSQPHQIEDEDLQTGLEHKQAIEVGTKSYWNPGSSVSPKSFEVDFNMVVKNIEELNMLNGADRTVIAHTKAGAMLKAPDAVPLTLYANGILMFSGPFRPYTDSTTQHCIQDLMDGYFPSELQDRYPDGISIKVTDKREVVYRDRRTHLLFPGAGQSLDNNKVEETLESQVGCKTQVHSLENLEETETSVPVEKFLHRLPPSVIKNGKIIDIRSGFENTIKGPQVGSKDSQVSVIDTPVIQEIKSRAQSGGNTAANYNVTTLRIKSEMGDQTYILKLKSIDTIASVRKYINKERPELRDQYQIKTSFPNMTYDDVSKSLDEAGLVPNATLHILRRT